MPANQPRQYLICYDIRDPARLNRVHRFMTGVATALQYSVFTGFYTEAELSRVLGDLESIIDGRTDDVRAYPLPATPRVVSLGRGMFPRGILLVERGRDLLHDGADGQALP